MLDPKISFVLNIVIATLAVIVAGGPHMFPEYVPAIWAGAIVQTAAFVVAIVSGVNGAMHGFSSPTKGPLVSTANSAGKIAAVALMAMLLLPLLHLNAWAQGVSNPSGAIGGDGGAASPAPAPTGLPNVFNFGQQSTAAASDPATSFISSVVAANKALLGRLTTDAQALLSLFGTGSSAVSESLQYPNLQDGNGHDCAVQGQQFSRIIHDHPLALTGRFIDDLENQRIIFAAAEKVCNAPSCQAVFGELSAQVSKLSSVVNGAVSGTLGIIPGIGAAAGIGGAAATAISSQNLFTMACGNLTNISLVPPTIAASSAPAASPTPAATP